MRFRSAMTFSSCLSNLPISKQLKLSNATVDDAEQIFSIINSAYAVEVGTTGIAFKKANMRRLEHPFENSMKSAYEDNRVIKAEVGDALVGVIVWDILEIEDNQISISFGPFAITPEFQGKGIGRILIEYVESIGKTNGASSVDIRVINHRSDSLSMYTSALGFQDLGITSPYPIPGNLSRPSHFIHLRKQISSAKS